VGGHRRGLDRGGRDDGDVTLVLAVAPEHAQTAAATASAILDASHRASEDLPDVAIVPTPDAELHGLVARADAVLLDRPAADVPAALVRRATRLLRSEELAEFVAALPSPSPRPALALT
jgi:hypothetical protein